MKVKLLISHLVIGAFGATMAVAAFPKVMSAQTVTQADQSARPGPVAEGLRVELKIDTARDGALYVPKGYTVERPAPLLLWLHGAGGTGQVSDMLGALADEFGYIVLAPDSREWTWGAILGRWDADLDFIQKAIRQGSRSRSASVTVTHSSACMPDRPG
ncbi:MAG: hypothetical protein DMF89_13940 [Acidobacteria bacterium]|nr:MAG: hypothetical protein DMF89_13940 [Acidobacteriota bacterium]